MSITSHRRKALGIATAPIASVSAVHSLLQRIPAGLTLSEVAGQSELSKPDAADAISVGVDQGLLRFSVEADGLRLYAAEHFSLPVVPPKLVDQVVNFIAAHEDTERGSPDVALSPEDVLSGFQGQWSSSEVLAAFDTLRVEEMTWFRLNGATGRGTVTLSRHRSFTIVGRDAGASEPLCFHVRAGTPEVAKRKVDESDYGREDLTLFGITEGEVYFQPIGPRAMLVVRL